MIEGNTLKIPIAKTKPRVIPLTKEALTEINNAEGGNREMWGVIEAPIHKMLKAFPDEFKFMKHETRRSLDGKRSVRSKTTRQHG